jgi:hypothetical protein
MNLDIPVFVAAQPAMMKVLEVVEPLNLPDC